VYHHTELAKWVESGQLGGYKYDPDLTRFQRWDPYYFLPYEDILKSACLFTSIGNHDFDPTYEGFLYLPHNNPLETELYYSFNYGNAHFIALDSRKDQSVLSTADLWWLREDLEQASKDPDISWIIVFFHHAPFGSGFYHRAGGEPGQVMEQYYVPVFEEFGVDVVFSGHVHAYERTCPMLAKRCTAPNDGGVLYIVTGGGGRPPLIPNQCGADCPWSEVYAAVHHFVKVVVDGQTLIGEAIDLNGNVMDAFTIRK